MAAQRNHYEVLGVSPTANTDQIKTKYRELARKFHPDVVQDKALGQKVFTQINQAYRVLADPERRADYDSSLRSAIPSSAVAAQAGRQTAGAVMNGHTAVYTSNGNGTRTDMGAGSTSDGHLGGGVNAQQQIALTRLINDADFAMLNSDPAAALARCESALRLDPHNAKALGLQGDALAGVGRLEEAAASYRRSLQVMPSPMIQSKLSRLAGGGSTQTLPPGGVTRTLRPGAAAPARSSAPEQSSSGGLFGRLMGKKK